MKKHYLILMIIMMFLITVWRGTALEDRTTINDWAVTWNARHESSTNRIYDVNIKNLGVNRRFAHRVYISNANGLHSDLEISEIRIEAKQLRRAIGRNCVNIKSNGSDHNNCIAIYDYVPGNQEIIRQLNRVYHNRSHDYYYSDYEALTFEGGETKNFIVAFRNPSILTYNAELGIENILTGDKYHPIINNTNYASDFVQDFINSTCWVTNSTLVSNDMLRQPFSYYFMDNSTIFNNTEILDNKSKVNLTRTVSPSNTVLGLPGIILEGIKTLETIGVDLNPRMLGRYNNSGFPSGINFTINTWLNKTTDSSGSFPGTQAALFEFTINSSTGDQNNNFIEFQVEGGTATPGIRTRGFVNGLVIFQLPAAGFSFDDFIIRRYHMFTLVVTDDFQKMYLDGVLIESDFNNTIASLNRSVEMLLLGSFHDGSSTMEGVYDEFGIWDVGLTDFEVSQLFVNGSAKRPETITCQYFSDNFDLGNVSNTFTPIFNCQGNCSINVSVANTNETFINVVNNASLNLTPETNQSFMFNYTVGLTRMSPSNITNLTIIFEFPPPPPPTPNVTGNFSCLIFDDTCIDGAFKCLLAVNNLTGVELTSSRDAFDINCQSINIGSFATRFILFGIILLFIFFGFRFKRPWLISIGGLFGIIFSFGIAFQFVLFGVLLGIFFLFFVLSGIIGGLDK